MTPTQPDLKQRQLDLLLAIDDLRDQISEEDPPKRMYVRLLQLLLAHLPADAGAILVHDANDKTLDTAIGLGTPELDARALCQPLLTEETTDRIHTLSVNGWPHAIGVQVVMAGHGVLGGVILLRGEAGAPFSEQDQMLLRVAERQLDSAIIQAQRLWRLAQRNRELHAIFELDRLRDEKSDENELVNGFIQILLEHSNTTLCMVMLSDIDNGQLNTRGMVDRLGLSPASYDTILKNIQHIDEISDLPAPKPGVALLGAPFIMNGMLLGGVVVGKQGGFDAEDRRLLQAMVTQMDSAIVYSRVIKQLSQRNKELQIIYHIDRIRDTEADFDAMLQAVLGEMCTAIEAEMGYILLYTADEEDQLEIKSSTAEGIVPSQQYYQAIHATSRQALEGAAMVVNNTPQGDVRSVVAVPLILRDKVIGVFGGLNSRNPHGFNAEDKRMLNAIVSQTDTAVFERMEQRRVRQVLGRSMDPKVLSQLLGQDASYDLLARERMNISVLFADLRGSTEWAERTEPDALAQLLNEYLARMTDAIFAYGGTLDKFVGDEVIGLFGAPLPMPDHARRCAAAALAMQNSMRELIREVEGRGLEMPPMGVGISTGDAICGEFGTSQRTDYTAMGRMMNLGARLCGAAKGGEIVISEMTYQQLGQGSEVEHLTEVKAKGIGHVNAYKLLNMELDILR